MSIFSLIKSLFGLSVKKKKRIIIMGRRGAIMRALPTNRYCSCYTVSKMTGISPDVVSKTLSAAFYDGLPLQRERMIAEVPRGMKRRKRHIKVWCYKKITDPIKLENMKR